MSINLKRCTNLCEYIENPRIKTKSQLIETRKKRAFESSQFFANNLLSTSCKISQSTTLSTKPGIFLENPASTLKFIKKQKDLENLSTKFSKTKKGIHSNELPKFSQNLEKAPFLRVLKVPSPKENSVKRVKSCQSIEKVAENWTWLKDSSDIVEFNQLKRSIKIQEENFKNKREKGYSEYFSKLFKDKEHKEKLVYAIRNRQRMLIQNRVSKFFKTDGFFKREYVIRTSGFLNVTNKVRV